jgi:hypothetical protein
MGRVGHNVSVRVENAIKNRRLQEGAQ